MGLPASLEHPESPPWYKKPAHDSDNDDNDNDFEFLTGASTPLHINHAKTMMFMSPMKKLDELHISNLDPPQEEDSDEDLGNKTIPTDFSESDDDNALSTPARTYIRKRKHDSLDMMITPGLGPDHTIPHVSTSSMSIVEDLALKISFTPSDTTPCPSQPRKKLRFKDSSEELTPSQKAKARRPLLNVSGSRKLSATNVPLLSKLNDAQDDNTSDVSPDSSAIFTSAQNQQSTPISQSTPANSRAPSPGIFGEETNKGVNGYNFVKPTQFKYQTPQTRPTSAYPHNSQHLINAYNTSDFHETTKYKIVGEFPVTSAGLMNEDDEDLHVGDKRINDPYVHSPPASSSPDLKQSVIRHAYLESVNKLPLLLHFERDLTIPEMMELVNDNTSVSAFYDYITDRGSEELLLLLKKERLKWHPDKWVNRYEQSGFDKAIIDSLSQVINSLVESL